MSNTNPNVEARLAQLEDQVQQLRNVHSVEDDSGQEWTAGDLMQLGLTRRQALAAIGTLAIYGGSIWGAIQLATDKAAAATDQVGTPSTPVDVHADMVSTEQANSTVFVHPSDSLSSKVSELSVDDRLVILPGSHTTTGDLAPPDGVTIRVDGTVTLAASTDATIFERTDGANDITICGKGRLDGNKSNQSFNGNRTDYELVRFIGGGSQITIRDIEIRNVLAGAGITIDGVNDLHIENVYIHSNGTSSVAADGIFHNADNAVIKDCRIEDVTDTHIAGDDCTDTSVCGNVCLNNDSYNTNVGTASQCLSCYAANADWDGEFKDNVLKNPGSGSDVITGFNGGTGYGVEVEISGNKISGAHSMAINLNFDTINDALISDNHLQGGTDGIDGSTTAALDVQGNTFEEYTGAFAVSPRSSESKVHDNTVKGGGNLDRAVSVWASGVTVEGNTFLELADEGVDIKSGNEDVIVDGNRIDDANDGVEFRGDNVDCLVTDNRIINCTNGITRTNSGNDYNIITSNNFRSTTTAFNGSAGTNSLEANNLA